MKERIVVDLLKNTGTVYQYYIRKINVVLFSSHVFSYTIQEFYHENFIMSSFPFCSFSRSYTSNKLLVQILILQMMYSSIAMILDYILPMTSSFCIYSYYYKYNTKFYSLEDYY